MRDFRDAKVMAHALRGALQAKAIETTHSESLELIAKVFGYASWNVLSAKIEVATQGPTTPKTLYCSFCGKSQHDVRKLIAGPSVCICDECAELCMDIVEGESPLAKVLGLLSGAGEGSADGAYRAALELLRGQATAEVAACVQAATRSIKQRRLLLDAIRRGLAMWDGQPAAGGDVQSRFAFLRTKTRDELCAMQRESELALERYEDALRIGTTVLSERSQEAGT